MQVTMTMEELVDREYQLKDKYSTEILEMKNRFDMEINSLKSQLELKEIDDVVKSSGCDFCNGKMELNLKKGLDIGISNNKLDFYYQTCACGAFEDKLIIAYCPMCGKKLEEQTMTTLHFDKISWIKENKYEYYLDVKLPNEQIPKIVSFVEYNILVESYGEIVPCEIKIISNEWLRIMNDKPFAGNIRLSPKEYIEDIKVDRISQIKDEISEFDKVVEKLYKNGNLNSTAYYTIKGFELALNNIIDYKGGIN